jgi:hypothetical protein
VSWPCCSGIISCLPTCRMTPGRPCGAASNPQSQPGRARRRPA